MLWKPFSNIVLFLVGHLDHTGIGIVAEWTLPIATFSLFSDKVPVNMDWNSGRSPRSNTLLWKHSSTIVLFLVNHLDPTGIGIVAEWTPPIATFSVLADTTLTGNHGLKLWKVTQVKFLALETFLYHCVVFGPTFGQ